MALRSRTSRRASSMEPRRMALGTAPAMQAVERVQMQVRDLGGHAAQHTPPVRRRLPKSVLLAAQLFLRLQPVLPVGAVPGAALLPQLVGALLHLLAAGLAPAHLLLGP